jgi:hypothetical protein
MPRIDLYEKMDLEESNLEIKKYTGKIVAVPITAGVKLI